MEGSLDIVAMREDLRPMVEQWIRSGRYLDEVRRDQIREADTIAAISALDIAYWKAIRDIPPKVTSGLDEYCHFMKMLYEKSLRSCKRD